MASKIDRIHLRVRTGDQALAGPVRLAFNGHVLGLEPLAGGTGPGETFEGTIAPMSVAHTVHLVGPDAGSWDIQGVELRFQPAAGDPWEVMLGPIELTAEQSLDLWYPPPLPTFEV